MQKPTQILKKQTSLFGEDSSMFSVEGSPVSHTALRESEKAKKITATSGRICLEQYGKFNQVTSWAKMFAALLIGMEGWYSTRCKLTWKLRATKSHRFYFQLVPLTPRTEETEYGLLPTITTETGRVSDFKQGGKSMWTRLKEVGLLPTPTANNWKGTVSQKAMTRKDGKMRDDNLQNLPAMIGASGQLNPLFVTEMMGFPSDWLRLPFQAKTEQESLLENKPMGNGEKKV